MVSWPPWAKGDALNDLGMDAALEVVVVFGELIRRGGEWVFSANSAGFPGGLEGLCRQYGVSV